MATYYVSATTGHDSTDGLAPVPDGAGAGPKATIGAAENLAQSAGDVVYIAPGTYRESVSHGYSGTSGNRIYFIGDPDCEIFPKGYGSSAQARGVSPGIVRITRADADELGDDTSGGSTINTSGRDYITWKNVHVDGIVSGVNAYNDRNTGYGFRASGGVADYLETHNCMVQNMGYGFSNVRYVKDCVAYGNTLGGYYYCGEVRNSISFGNRYGAYLCDFVVNSIMQGIQYACYLSDIVFNSLIIGSYYGLRGNESSINQPQDLAFDNWYFGNFIGHYGTGTGTTTNALESGSYFQNNVYIGRYGYLHGLGQNNNYYHWSSATYEPVIGKNGSTNMNSDGLFWPQKPQTLNSINNLMLLKKVFEPVVFSKGIQGCTSTVNESVTLDLLEKDENFNGIDDTALINRPAGSTDINGNPRFMGSTRGMYMEGTSHTTSSRDIGPYEFSNVEATGSFSSSAAGFKIEDEGLFRIPITVSASVAITASIGVKHLSGVGTAIKPQFQLRYSESMPTASLGTPSGGMITGSDLIIQSVTSTAADNVFETLTVSHSATENRELELICTNVQTGSDSISVFSDLEIK